MSTFLNKRGKFSNAFRVVSAVAVLLCLVSCVHTYEIRTAEPQVELTRESDAHSDTRVVVVSEPFMDLIKARDTHAQEIHDASELAIAECMKEKGFHYEPAKYSPRMIDIVHFGDLEFAEREGFGLAYEEDFSSPVGDDPLSKMSVAEAATWKEAFGGKDITPEDIAAGSLGSDIVVIEAIDGSKRFFRKNSCLAKGESSIVGDIVEWRSIEIEVEAMSNKVLEGIEADIRMISVMKDWAECMKEQGYSSKSRRQHKEDLQEKAVSGVPLDKVKSEEISVAKASATCEMKLGVGWIYQKIQSELETKALEDNQSLVIRFQELNKQAAARASELQGR